MGLLDDYDYTPGLAGIGGPARPADFHQLAISYFVEFINKKLAGSNFRALPEQKLEKKIKGEMAPDVVIVDLTFRPFKPVWFLEVEKTSRIKKLQTISFEMMQKYEIRECLILDYEKRKWFKLYDFQTWPNPNPSQSFSEFLKVDMADAINWDFYYED